MDEFEAVAPEEGNWGDGDEEADPNFSPSEDEESEDDESGSEVESEEEEELDKERLLAAKVNRLKDNLDVIWNNLAQPRSNQNGQSLEHEPLEYERLWQDVEGSQAQFITKYREYMAPQDDEIKKAVNLRERNLLYRIAIDTRPDQRSDWLVRYLVKEHPKLLDEKDESQVGPLLMAIEHDKIDFIREVVQHTNSESLKKVISASWFDKRNAIHAAIQKSIDPDLTIELIQKAAEKTLGDQNSRGLTPLHLAVEYARCTPSRLPVVLALIQHGDVAFDRISNAPDSLSVYRYHLESKRKHENEAEKDKKPASKTAGKGDKTKKQSTQKTGGDDGPKKDVKSVKEVLPGRGKDQKSDSRQESRRGGEPADRKNLRKEAMLYKANESRHVSHSQYVEQAGSVLAQPPKNNSVSSLIDQGPDEKSKRPKLKKSGKSSTRSSARHSTVKEAPDPIIASQIAMELKLHYLRSIFHSQGSHSANKNDADANTTATRKVRTHDSAVDFLYGKHREDKHICFEFPPYTKQPGKIDFDQFKASYRGFKFDEVLQYVDFRGIELDTPVRKRPAAGDAFPGKGKRDMKRFFDWLWEKDVRYIIKASVEDRDGIPHSDEAIEDALKRFKIEILDWRKVDIDSRAIQEACQLPTDAQANPKGVGQTSKLRELHLWWSGNNAILRSWSEPEGLVLIPSLTTIHLYETELRDDHGYHSGLDSSKRTRSNLEQFETRLRTNRRPELEPIKVERHRRQNPATTPKARSQQSADSQGRPQIDPHRWLTVMDEFARGIYHLEPPESFPGSYLSDPDLPADLRRDVRVALIDDGVSFMYGPVTDKIESGKGFDASYHSDPDRVIPPDPFHGSTTGHGTYMAYMIGRVCPRVKIFVCKLNMTAQQHKDKASFTAKSAADAVEFAVNRGFDIISMSWTIQKTKDNKEDIERLEKALKDAVSKKMIIFCSAPDIGKTGSAALSEHYPFGCPGISDGIFKIGAAKADGNTYSWMGSADNVDFILPGHNVQLCPGDEIADEDKIPKTGSSVATALAAGLAALLLHCVRLGAIYNHYQHKSNTDPAMKRSNDPNASRTAAPQNAGVKKLTGNDAVSIDSWRTIRRFHGMKDAFNTVSRHASKGYKDKNLEVQHFFNDPAGVNGVESKAGAEEKWIKITQLARDLVSGNLLSRTMTL